MCDEKTKKMSFFFACSTQIQHKNSFVQFAIDMQKTLKPYGFKVLRGGD